MISSSTTVINSTQYKNTLKFIKEPIGIRFKTPQILDFEILDKFKKDEPGLIDLISDQPKVFISTTQSLYHLYHDDFSELLTQYELTPNAKFLIDITGIGHIDPLPEYIKMIFKFLNKNNIDYRPIDLMANNIMNINNLYYRDPQAESFAINNPPLRLHDFAKMYVSVLESVPTRRVYLSRKNFKNRDLSFFIKGRLPYDNDNRMDNEKEVEDYFASIGFEIVIPEDFKTFEEQMDFFYNVKTIVSTTSSGLINSCFMRPGSKMIELVTPLISFDRLGNGVTDFGSKGQEEIHHFYHTIAMAMQHKYMSISNSKRSSKVIIDTIESDSSLKEFILS